MARGVLWLACSLLISMGYAPSAWGSESEPSVEMTARELFEQGLAASREGAWLRAESLYRRSYAAVPRSSTAFNLALALLHDDHPTEALRMLKAAEELASPEERAAYMAQLGQMRAHAFSRLAWLELLLSPPGAQVIVDTSTVTGNGPRRRISVDPGAHQVEITAEGYRTHQFDVSVEPGETFSRTVTLMAQLPPEEGTSMEARGAGGSKLRSPGATPTQHGDAPLVDSRSAAPRKSSRLLPYSLLGVGGAALLSSGITGLVAVKANDSLLSLCGDPTHCDESNRSEAEPLERRARRSGIATDVLWISGALTVGVGLVVLLVDSRSKRKSHAAWAGLHWDGQGVGGVW